MAQSPHSNYRSLHSFTTIAPSLTSVLCPYSLHYCMREVFIPSLIHNSLQFTYTNWVHRTNLLWHSLNSFPTLALPWLSSVRHYTDSLWYWSSQLQHSNSHYLARFRYSITLRWTVDVYNLQVLRADPLKTPLATPHVLLRLVIHRYPATGYQHLPQKMISHRCVTSSAHPLYRITSCGVSRARYPLPRYYCARQAQ
jgi:hypothetical protein